MEGQELDVQEGPVTKKPKTETGVLTLNDERVAVKAERIILDEYSPPRYPPMVDQDGKPLLDDAVRQFKYMEGGCKSAWDWIRSAGESTTFGLNWILTNLDILQVANVTLKELDARTENGKDERTQAQSMMEQMEERIKRGVQDIHCFSTRVVDQDGELLVAYFAESPKVVPKKVSAIFAQVQSIDLYYRPDPRRFYLKRNMMNLWNR
jgi:hypothetical protein